MSLILQEAHFRASTGCIPIVQKLGYTSHGKKIVLHSMSYRDMKEPDLERLEAYLQRNPETNALGILMQTKYVNLDFDSICDYEWYVGAGLIEPVELATTSITQTASGKYHYIYVLPEHWAENYVKTIRAGGRDVDVLFGVNNVEYVYPTTLPDGRSYRKLGTPQPSSMPDKLRLFLEQLLTTKSGRKRSCQAAVCVTNGTVTRVRSKSHMKYTRWKRDLYPVTVTTVCTAKALQNAIPYRYIRDGRRLVREWTQLSFCRSLLRLYSVAILEWDGKSSIVWPHVACENARQRDVLLLEIDDTITAWVFADFVSGAERSSPFPDINMREYTLFRHVSQLWDLDRTLKLFPGLWTTCPRVLAPPNALLNHAVDTAAYSAIGRQVTNLETAVMNYKIIFPDPIQLLEQTQPSCHKWSSVSVSPGIDIMGSVEVAFYTSDGMSLHPLTSELMAHRLVFDINSTLLIPHAAFVARNLGLYLGKQPCTAAELCVYVHLRLAASRLNVLSSTRVAARFEAVKSAEHAHLNIPSYFNAPPCVKHVLAHGPLKHDKRWPLARLLIQTAHAAKINPDELMHMMLLMIRQCSANSFRADKWIAEYKSELKTAPLRKPFQCRNYKNARLSTFGCPYVADFPGQSAETCLCSREPQSTLMDIEDITPVDIWLKTTPTVPGPA